MGDNTFNEELLIGAFGTLCDFLVDMQLCARDCPYSGNRNEDGECNAWQVIHDIRSKREAMKRQITTEVNKLPYKVYNTKYLMKLSLTMRLNYKLNILPLNHKCKYLK